MDEVNSNKPTQVEKRSAGKGKPTGNPLAKGLNVNVSIPETIEIRMVDASVLSDYETGILIASLVANVFTGFLVAYLQESTKTYLLTNTIVFFVIFIIVLTYALRKRGKMTTTSSTVKLKAQEVITEDTEAL